MPISLTTPPRIIEMIRDIRLRDVIQQILNRGCRMRRQCLIDGKADILGEGGCDEKVGTNDEQELLTRFRPVFYQ